MRSLLLAGVAAFAFGASPAFAAPFWFLGDTIHECYDEGTDEDSVQIQCSSNLVDNDGWSNDNNAQIINQNQFGLLFEEPEDTLQVQIGRNHVEEGDDNTQVIDQSQGLFGEPDDNDDQQTQVAGNFVEDGDDNYQKIEQSQTLVVID